MMSYIDLNWDFSQFDQDNLNRFRAAAYIEGANQLAAEALGAEDEQASYAELRRADRLVGRAERAFAQRRYVQALGLAAEAYEWASRGAADAGVDVQRVEAEARVAAQAAREAGDVHTDEPAIIDTLDGPRGLD